MFINEITKSMYPNFITNNSNLAFDSLRGISTDDRNNKICYMSYYLEDDNYNLFFANTLKKIYNFDWQPLYIFRIVCTDAEYESLKNDMELADIHELLLFETMNNLINKNNSAINKNLLTSSNFPKFLNLFPKLGKEEMNDCKMFRGCDHLKRNLYLNIMSGCIFDNHRDDLNYFRIISYKNNGELTFIIEVNSDAKNYEYEDYQIYFYCIPDSEIKLEKLAQLLLKSFKKSLKLIDSIDLRI